MGDTNEILRYIGGTAGPDGDGWVVVLNGDDYAPAGGITDTLWVGPSPPTDSSIEMWWDTDDTTSSATSADVWNSGWGIVATGSLTTPGGGGSVALTASTIVQLTSTTPFTTQTGRRYRVVVEARAARTTTTSETFAYLYLRDGATALFGNSPLVRLPNNTISYTYLAYEWVIAGDGVNRSYNVAIQSVGQAAEVFTDTQGFFYIEDIGPVTRQPSSFTPPTTDWSPYDARYAATLSSTMTTHAAASEVSVAAVRMPLRTGSAWLTINGSVKNNKSPSGNWVAGDDLFTLPAGFLPIFGGTNYPGTNITNGSYASFNVSSSGLVEFGGIGTVANSQYVRFNIELLGA